MCDKFMIIAFDAYREPCRNVALASGAVIDGTGRSVGQPEVPEPFSDLKDGRYELRNDPAMYLRVRRES